MDSTTQINQLKYLLFKEEQEATQQLRKELKILRNELDQLEAALQNQEQQMTLVEEEMHNPKRIQEKVNPIINDKIKELKTNFYTLFGEEVKVTVNTEIRNSQDEFIEAVYPIIGKLVRRYVNYQFELFIEAMEEQRKNAFSWKRWRYRFKRWFGKGDEADIIEELLSPTVEEVYLIQKDSGLLLGSFSANNITDMDMVAGMFSAIRSSAEFIFTKQTEELRTIEYENFKVIIYDYYKYYSATVIDGTSTPSFLQKLETTLNSFDENQMPKLIVEVDDVLFKQVSKKLKKSFEGFEKNKPYSLSKMNELPAK
ncbi:MAG: hypothetical protein R3E32_12305 [Chitinophagales bacterium]